MAEFPPMCADFERADSSCAIRLDLKRAPVADCASDIAVSVDTVTLARYRAANTGRFGISAW